MINQVGQSDYFWWSIMKSQQKTFLKTVKPPVQISQRNGCTCILLYMYLITGIWPWRLRWLSRWWTRAVFWNYTRRVQRWTNCKSDTNDIIVSLCIIKLVWLSSSSSSPAPAPRRLTNTFWLVQPLWQLPSSSTLLCFTLFFLFWSRFEKFWILVNVFCVKVYLNKNIQPLCHWPNCQQIDAFLWNKAGGIDPYISPLQELIRMDWRFTSSLPVTYM